VLPISKNPRQYIVGLDYNSKTYSNIHKSKSAVLQLLSVENMDLINVLGKKSGNKYNKKKFLEKKKLLSNFGEIQVLKHLCALIFIEKNSETKTNGDHAIFVFNVKKTKTFRDDNILSTGDLIKNKIIL
tara:strand:- start:83 stop:469 length:387 start_codon:yes stop_codon:yes gene_type:complete